MIIKAKLQAAEAHAKGEYIVEDTSLYFECFENKLPGPFIKWFLDVLKPEGLAHMAEKMGNSKCTARTIVGYIDAAGEVKFFEGIQKGLIVPPRGEKDFGWGPIFQPENDTRTFAEMDRAEKFQKSMRAVAIAKLRDYLKLNKQGNFAIIE